MGNRIALSIASILCAAAAGCGSFRPKPLDAVPYLERAKTQSREGFHVTAAVLTPQESEDVFGVDLAGEQIQPVWLEIESHNDQPYWFMLRGLDPEYFSAREAAYKSHFWLRSSTNRKMDEHFGSLGIDQEIPPYGKTSGFAFSNLKLGMKEVRVMLFGPSEVETFEFYISVPGLRADYHEVDFDTLYTEDEFVNYDTEEELFAALKRLPCCTSRKDGTGKGDPVNIVLLGDGNDVEAAFIRAGWDETEVLTGGSAWRTFKAALFGSEYRYSPMSALYVFERPQDAGFQKSRESIHERNHLRLWLAPITYQGQPVFVGTISRDIGVYFTTHTWNLTTHAIDPDIDEARSYLSEDLVMTQAVERFGRAEGIGKATQNNPHRNLMDAPYWTDGFRMVYLIADEPVGLTEVDLFNLEWKAYEQTLEATQTKSLE